MASNRIAPLPAELPVKPVGWNKRMSLHMKTNGGGVAVYDITDDRGEPMPIGFGYCFDRVNQGKSRSGFFLHGGPADSYLSWAEMREAWPAYFQRLEGEDL
ncbi:hypothetical protein [Variovorax sp. J22R115]|uniref:hypothetical protein n=1 Tax=Variovorax sp. J22R115 TaxID=3053509 RepID=UPI0025763AF4|nr:hypothetical protein [Variovorax sp. J22R115]MDM0051409.1 hypothetical protein [Variovorax sp. J22R115]